jgi:long-chain-fatty-acid--[acyl-carrier-protein] ligase
VPYHFLFGARTFEFPRPVNLARADLSQVKPETKEAVREMLAEKVHRPLTPDDLKPDVTLDQLGLDSLDRMELTLAVEQRFGFASDQAPASVGELWALAQGLVERDGATEAPQAWRAGPTLTGIPEVLGETIAEALVNRALAQPKSVAVADDMAGVLTYERLLVGARVMSKRFKKLEAPNVGLLLPASVACDTAFLALHLAGKLPVLLNWTTGPANLAHAVRTMKLTHVITSRRFIDRLHLTIEGAKYLFLEDIRQGISKFELLRTLLSVRWQPERQRRKIPAVSPDQPAVILFTSGSEKAPKAVPLTHRNVLTNIRTGAPFLGFTREDSILGFLPPFHSFGMTVAMLMPILGGMRVVHHPDPTDAARLAGKIAGYRPTVLLGTPTFVSYIIERARPEELKSLRMIIVGSEKCPPSVRERCAERAPQAPVIEGYGITECSPAVAANRIVANKPGSLGQPFPGVKVCVVDLDTDQPLPANQQGMLLVNGPTVFPGYLDYDGPSPFRERNGERWYVTGDLAKVDDDGFIWFAGRLKRFLKAGGEMISLPALEEPFTRLFPPTEDGPRVAVEGIETKDGRRIVLFSMEEISLRDANARLQEEGFRGVMRFDEVRRIDKIPILGTGKTDYKVLRAMVAEGHLH